MVEIISIHIGKTAGTAFREVLSSAYGYSGVLWDYSPYPYQPPAELDKSIRAIHGHVPIRKYSDYFDDAKRIVWLRHPVFRLISEYYFARQYKDKENPLHRELVEKSLSFLDFAKKPAAQNIMSKQIAGLPLKSFFFVGLQEFYTSDLFELENLLDWEHHPVVIRNSNPEPEYRVRLRSILGNPDLVEQISRLNSEDMMLYQEALALRAERNQSSILMQETLAGWNRFEILLSEAGHMRK